MLRAKPTLRLRGTWLGVGCLLLALVALTASTAGAQTGLTLNLAGLSAEDDATAQAVLTVLDTDGRPVAGLSENDFEARLNGQPAPVAAVDRAVDSSLPIAIVLALDISGSMEGDALTEARTAAGHFLESLSPQDTVAVVTFGDRVDVVLPFTTNREAAAIAIDGLTAAGATALYQATDESLRLAATADSGRRAVVLLSDGLDHGSTLPREDTLTAAAGLGVPVFAIGLGQEIDRAYLQELSTTSGGRFAETPSPAGLADLYQAAAEQLRGQYIVTLDTAALEIVPSEPVRVTISLIAGGVSANAERAFCLQQLCLALSEATTAVDGPRTFVAEVLSSEPVTSVAFLLDGVQAVELTAPPYDFTFDPAAHEAGDYALTARAATASDEVETAAASLSVAAAGGSGGMLLLAVPVVLLVAAAAVVLFLLRRRGRGAGKERPLDPSGLVPPGKARTPDAKPDLPARDERPALQQQEEALGRLTLTGGPAAGQSFPVGGLPVGVGSGQSCLVQLSQVVDDEELIPAEHARVWIREGRLMVHEVRRLTADGAEGGRWEKLESGDALTVGPYTLVFQLDGDTTVPSPPAPDGGAPNILRSRDDDPASRPGQPNGEVSQPPPARPPASEAPAQAAQGATWTAQPSPPPGEGRESPPMSYIPLRPPREE